MLDVHSFMCYNENMTEVFRHQEAVERDIALWEDELRASGSEQLSDVLKWEQEMRIFTEVREQAEASEERPSNPEPKEDLEHESTYDDIDRELEIAVLENPEEPTITWTESNPDGTSTEAQYRQQCYWVIGQFGHRIDCVCDNITNEAEAEEWLEMKKTIQAAKSETDGYALAGIRSEMIPVWAEYVTRMNYDADKFARVMNT